MCGIVGYVGSRDAVRILLDGLRRLEYRGYDSAGLAVQSRSGLELRRSAGKIDNLCDRIQREPLSGTTGLGHTRWATHGRPSDANAHPHADCTGKLVVVHNGILENYLELKTVLLAEGHVFRSETDTEVMAHLIERELGRCADIGLAVRAAARRVRGAYALCVLSAEHPGRIVALKRGAGAVILGLGEGEAFVASDIPALLPYTRTVLILQDEEMAVISRGGVALSGLDGTPILREASLITWNAAMAEKAGYRHFMLKEINEQPEAVDRTIRAHVSADTGELRLPEANLTPDRSIRLQRIVLLSCGTSYHAAMIGRSMIERLAGVTTEVDLASEFRYRDAILDPSTLVVAVSQSGETADTLGAIHAAAELGARTLGITNVIGSALAREAHGVIYTYAGPEIGVASTKTFSATVVALYLLAVTLGRDRGFLNEHDTHKRLAEMAEMPLLMSETLALGDQVGPIAREVAAHTNLLYLGRGPQHPVALEGALKLKEISYIHAEGYAAGEMKHGPIALIDERMPVVVLTPRDGSYDRMVGNVEEIKARGGQVIAVCHQGDVEMTNRVSHVLEVAAAADLLMPILTTIPLQLLAYQVALLRGTDVDQPRNLAKSVTVE
jgi:glucosamine--fructose-6-phosphate aminotransferase (isomerizing)